MAAHAAVYGNGHVFGGARTHIFECLSRPLSVKEILVVLLLSINVDLDQGGDASKNKNLVISMGKVS